MSFDDSHPPSGFECVVEPLFYLAYRTLLFRISQFRGTEREIFKHLGIQIDSGNRFGVESSLDLHRDASSVLSQLYRFKDGFDRRVLGDRSAMPLVHHAVPFVPMVRYAASEFNRISHIEYRGVDHVWAAMNVLPVSGVTWFIVSHFRLSDNYHYSLVRNRVLDFVASSTTARREADLDGFLSWINLYVSIHDYRSLSECDRTFIESRIAWQVCQEPFSKGLEILASTPAGNLEIARVKRDLLGRG